MKILVDECLPAGLKGTLTALGRECQTVRTAGFSSKKNGELLTFSSLQRAAAMVGRRVMIELV